MTWKALLAATKTPPPATNASPAPPVNEAPAPQSSSGGFFQLPPSPRSLARQREEATKVQESNHVSPTEAPRVSPFHPQLFKTKPKITPPSPPPPISTWFIDESSQQKPMATSPIKGSSLREIVISEPCSCADRRKVRLLFAQEFVEGIQRLEEERRKIHSFFDPETDLPGDSNNSDNIRVFVRKRPMPAGAGEDFDVVRTVSDEDSSTPSLVVYHTEIQHDLRKKEVKPAIFGPFASCFGERVASGEIYGRSVKSLVETAKSGGMATLLMFGQSQTGKTYTMSAVEGMVARDIFTGLPYNHAVKVTVVELCGTQCLDLLDVKPSPVRIADIGSGGVKFVNALSLMPATPEDLLATILAAKKRHRRTDFCHFLCRIAILPPPDAPACIRSGALTLVDCAGTERRPSGQKDSHHFMHSATGAEINASLRVLKECLWAKIGGTGSPPYDGTSLTRCLREGLEREDATFHILATVSPKATDTEATIETLGTVSRLLGGFAEELSHPNLPGSTNTANEDSIPLHPKAWDRARLGDWMLRKHLIQDKSFVPLDMNGRTVMRLTKAELQKVFFDGDWKKADILYRCLRAESDRVARLDLKRQMATERLQRTQYK